MRRHVVLRPNRQIEREVPVCAGCHRQLATGTPLVALTALHRQPVPQVVADVHAGPPSVVPIQFKS